MGVVAVALMAVVSRGQATGQEEEYLTLPSRVAFLRPQKQPLSVAPIQVVNQSIGGSRYVAVVGGRPGSRLVKGRFPVQWFVKQAGAQAGINGAFFVMAAIRSTNSAMIGPVLAENGPGFVPCKGGVDSPKLGGRPLVIWSLSDVAFLPYRNKMMNSPEGLSSALPGATGAFVAGAWLIQDGRRLTGKEILAHGPRDAERPRRRAMFGMTNEGRPVLLAALSSVTSSMLAKAAEQLGCRNAALLDSGFSTSLVLGDKVLVSGHSTSKTPSRPVPHAIVLYGPDGATAQ